MNWTIFNETMSLILHARSKAHAFELLDRGSKMLGCSGLVVLHILPGKPHSGFPRIELFSRNERIARTMGRLKRELFSDGLKPLYRAARPTHISDARSFLKARLLSRLTRLASIAKARSLLFIPVSPQDHGTFCFVYFGKQVSDDYTSMAALSTLAHATIETIVADKAPAKPIPEIDFTQREVDCLRLMVTGMDDAEIAAAVGISERTVRFHLDRARAKMGARNRVHAVAMIVGEHLLDR